METNNSVKVEDFAARGAGYELMGIFLMAFSERWIGKWESESPKFHADLTASEKKVLQSYFSWIDSEFKNGVDPVFKKFVGEEATEKTVSLDIDDISCAVVQFSRLTSTLYPIRVSLYRK